jgi:hypothetical protein
MDTNKQFPDIDWNRLRFLNLNVQVGDLITYSSGGHVYYAIFRKLTPRSVQYISLNKANYDWIDRHGNPYTGYINTTEPSTRITKVDMESLPEDVKEGYLMLRDKLFEINFLK